MVAYLLFRFVQNLFRDLEDFVEGCFITLVVLTIILLDIIICLLWPEQDDD